MNKIQEYLLKVKYYYYVKENNMNENKKFILYLIRWQLSTPILALCLKFLNYNTLINTIIANFIGGCIFFFIDKNIFKEK